MEHPSPERGITLPAGEAVGRRAVVWLVCLLFLGGCVTPAVGNPGESLSFRHYDGYHLGFHALVFGWSSRFAPPWFANVLLLVGLLLLAARAYGAAAGFGGAAFLLGLTVWLFKRDCREVVHPAYAITDLYVGYYLWQGSLLALAVGAGLLKLHCPPGEPPPGPGWAGGGNGYAARWSARAGDATRIAPFAPEVREDSRAGEGGG